MGVGGGVGGEGFLTMDTAEEENEKQEEKRGEDKAQRIMLESPCSIDLQQHSYDEGMSKSGCSSLGFSHSYNCSYDY